MDKIKEFAKGKKATLFAGIIAVVAMVLGSELIEEGYDLNTKTFSLKHKSNELDDEKNLEDNSDDTI